jgi:endonuclease/exonuclease/phosphatase family metal-dependent hydrolase
MLRVMSFNLRVATIFDIQNHWEFRKAKAVAAIRNFNPDILGTQECENVHADYLKASLPDYGFVGVGRNDGKTSGEMCGLFYKKQTLEKLAEGHFWLSKTPQVPGSKSFGSWFTRMCTWVKLKHTQTGQIIFAFDTHLDSNSSNAREKQAELLRQKIQEIAGDAPVVLTGDFNTGDLSAPYTQLVGPHSGIALTLTDAFRATHTARGKQEGSFHGFHGGKSGERIDWILASSALLPVSAAIDYASCANGYVSDHYPVK